MKFKAYLLSFATLSCVAFGLSNIAANCQAPPTSTIITVEGWVCSIAEAIPPIAGYAQYLCAVIGQNGKQIAAVKVPLDQVAAFEKAHRLVTPAEFKTLTATPVSQSK